MHFNTEFNLFLLSFRKEAGECIANFKKIVLQKKRQSFCIIKNNVYLCG